MADKTKSPVEAVPPGYHAITPYLAVQGVPAVMDFLARAFGAKEVFRHAGPDGAVANAEMEIDGSKVMLGELPKDRKAMTAMLNLYVSDADAVYARAVAAGGASIMEPNDRSYGDRVGAVADPAGTQWWIATRKR